MNKKSKKVFKKAEQYYIMALLQLANILMNFITFLVCFLLSFRIGKRYYKLANSFLFLSLAFLFAAAIAFLELSGANLVAFHGLQIVLFVIFLTHVVAYIKDKSFIQLLIPLIFIIPIYFSGLNFWIMTSILCLLVALEAFALLFREFRVISVLGIAACCIYIIQLIMSLMFYYPRINSVYFNILLMVSFLLFYKETPLLKLGPAQTVKAVRIKRPWEYSLFSLSMIILVYNILTHFSSFFYVFSFFSLLVVSVAGMLTSEKSITMLLSFFSFISFSILIAYEILWMGFLEFAAEEIIINFGLFKIIELIVIGILLVSGFLFHRSIVSKD